MRVTTNINKLDLIRFNLSVIPRLKSTYITALIFSALAFSYICWESGVPQSVYNLGVSIMASILSGTIGMLFCVVFNMILILFMSSEKNGILGEHHYTISNEGLHEETAANEGLSKWEGIVKIINTGSYILFQISGYLFHIIPTRSFESKQEFDKYYEIATEYWNKAHNKAI